MLYSTIYNNLHLYLLFIYFVVAELNMAIYFKIPNSAYLHRKIFCFKI